MNFKQIRYDVADNIATIVLHRPEHLNAWTATMMAEILLALDLADADDGVRAVIVTGSGRAFCAGSDLSAGDFLPSDDSGQRHRDTAGQAALRLFNLKKPVIGAINGAAVGVGITLTLAMDIRIASQAATKIGFIFNRRGIVPEGCSTYFLPRIVGISRALELILSAKFFTAEEGLAMGLFSRVVAPEALLPTAREIATEIASNTSAVSTALARQMLWKNLGENHPMAAHILESRCLDYMFRSVDGKDGAASFAERRAPVFKMTPSRHMPDFFPWWKEPPYIDD
ncbi:MAG: enoyl-CoA hydratase-related protein [Desulfobacterales bacterium]|jgi:enoyl-CoA hydratase/carnithine racemase|nr:enoyl-CoA hydratase-related protein [Desulfobacterales bacterium]